MYGSDKKKKMQPNSYGESDDGITTQLYIDLNSIGRKRLMLFKIYQLVSKDINDSVDTNARRQVGY